MSATEEMRGPGPVALAVLLGVLFGLTATSASALLLAATAVGLDSPPLLLTAVALVTVAFGIGQPAMISAVGGSVEPEVRGLALGVATFLFLVGAGVGGRARRAARDPRHRAQGSADVSTNSSKSGSRTMFQ